MFINLFLCLLYRNELVAKRTVRIVPREYRRIGIENGFPKSSVGTGVRPGEEDQPIRARVGFLPPGGIASPEHPEPEAGEGPEVVDE